MNDPVSAEVALARLTERARRSGTEVERDRELVLRALRAEHRLDDAGIDRVARVLWSSWRGVGVRGFNALSRETKTRWRDLARRALEELGYSMTGALGT